MPWTFSHPAVVFPIKQSKIGKFLNLPALIIGSISPDLFYSVGLFKLATKAHHIIGWIYTAFPLCVVLFIIFSIFLTNLNKILPITIEPYKKLDLSKFLIIIFSLFIGAVTHIVWDGFTHKTGSFVRNIHFLQYNLIETISSNRQELRIYKFLQYAGSVFGLLYLCLKYRQYRKKLNPVEQEQNIIKLYQLCKLAILSIGISLPFAYFLTQQYKIFNINKFIFNELRIAELVFFALIFIIALWIKYRKNET
ncbi:unnamed protein product [Commensalibacter communis]|uniref:DUF4184 family protein n=1 Tax=Commensalibacter communis TaxID=2972786 RepID=UPI0022FF70C7|nr:DUF4184 family protein [Commensalibacter communis]CAI3922282.1 unnamed protein product [Commensalibacter communis]CAI3937277.1 unnamed protein product [Commensalibacter communis]